MRPLRERVLTAIGLCAIVLAASGIGPAAAAAQERRTAAAMGETGSIEGLVLDQTDMQPLEGVVVALHDFDVRARTDEHGRFTLPGLPAGELVVKVEADGYVTLVEKLGVAPSELSVVHFHMARITALLDELLVDVPGDTEDLGRGHSVTDVVATENMRTAADMLLRSVPGLSATRTQGASGSGLVVRMRGVSSFILSETPSIYLDGVRIDGTGSREAIEVLDQIRASSIKRIRVLRGPASASRYPNAAAGVILIETRGLSDGPGR
jgi:iron complex outermembrane receptor protein